ncbi:MAG: Ca2+-dependent phosphoinositide-specific phospholipase C [Lacinutrix venerupis]
MNKTISLSSIAVLATVILFMSLNSCKQEEKVISIENNTVLLPADTKINQIQVLGTHNSYAKPVDPKVIELADPILKQMGAKFMESMTPEQLESFNENHPHGINFKDGLAYEHPDFNTQLNAGLRSLEIDVHYDPTGNRFTKPASYELLKQKGVTNLLPFDSLGLKKPGFKVFHAADLDFRSHYTTFKQALTVLKDWSNKNPTHAPIYIMIEAKDMGMPIFPNPSKVLPFTADTYDLLDAEVLNTLGKDKVITPSDVKGDFATLEEAVLANNWPTIENALGKFVFMLLPGSAGVAEEDIYVENHPNLDGRAMFVRSKIGRPHAAFLLLDNALVRKKDIQNAVKKGYLVRTRSDIETYEAKMNDYSRAEAAFESGAQVISTDFFKPGNAYGTDYVVKMPNGKPTRLNPINTSK